MNAPTPPSSHAPSAPEGPAGVWSRHRWAIGGAALVAAALAVALFVSLRGGIPSPPVAADPFLNTNPEVAYVGSDACRDCHTEAHDSFRRTGMGRSMAKVDPVRQPPDASFDHAASKTRYQVRRKGGRIWHRELLPGTGAEEVVLAEHPLEYVVGSGRHSLTYLVEVDGFLVESPVTWFTSRKAWDMSPGYDYAGQPGFQRPVTEGCLFCHSGRAWVEDRSLHRIHVSEAAIGCERCHGPGSLHVRRWEGQQDEARGDADLTIVNPARLSRDLGESICQQCHLMPAAVVPARGKKLADFRPGLPLADFIRPYEFRGPDRPMTVVGHVEQMHLSRCYQASGTLTCTTCHNPHDEPAAGDAEGHYNAVCRNCHAPERCTVSPARRERESPRNNCTQCHMPASPTDIAHLAFTHHRIGIHRQPAPASGGAVPRDDSVLQPFFDVAGLSEGEQQRSLGLAYFQVSDDRKDRAAKVRYAQRAVQLLERSRSGGMRDSRLDASLAWLRFEDGTGAFLPSAESALLDPDLGGQERCNALFLISATAASQGRNAEAAARLRQLTRLRRHAVDWLLLAECEAKLGRQAAATEARETAVRINPRLRRVHLQLAEEYRRQGDERRAAWHERRASP